jgi:hypothetical protein
MSKREQVAELCGMALKRVDESIARHERGDLADLSISMLMKIRKELLEMEKHLNPSAFKPTYPRFVLDWPDKTGLVSYLSNVAYQYGRIKG